MKAFDDHEIKPSLKRCVAKPEFLVLLGWVATFGGYWFSCGPWLALSIVRNGIKNPIALESKPDAADVFVAWLNALGGLALQLIGLTIAVILISKKYRGQRWHGVALMLISVVIIGIAASRSGLQPTFDHTQLRFVPSYKAEPPDAARNSE